MRRARRPAWRSARSQPSVGPREETGTLLVVAKELRPGHVKTRLHSRFTPEQAVELAEAALRDTIDAASVARARRRVLVLDGRAGGWLPAGMEVQPQRGDGLDERLAAAFEDASTGRGGDGPMLLLGMDTPQVTPALLDVDWRGADAMLGLSPDGGYWAIGLREARAEALIGVQMSTPDTGAVQLERLLSLGLRVRTLPELLDVDTPADAEAVARSAPGTRFAAAHRRIVDGQRTQRLLVVARRGHPTDDVDRLMISRCEPPVLDIGCGPGRLAAAACESGLAALGVDLSGAAIQQITRGDGSVLRRRIQDRLPAEGRWGTVLLADGSIGLGGDPEAMLARCRDLLRPGGLLLVEAEPGEAARLGSRALADMLARHDFSVVEEWRAAQRVLLGARSLQAT